MARVLALTEVEEALVGAVEAGEVLDLRASKERGVRAEAVPGRRIRSCLRVQRREPGHGRSVSSTLPVAVATSIRSIRSRECGVTTSSP